MPPGGPRFVLGALLAVLLLLPAVARATPLSPADAAGRPPSFRAGQEGLADLAEGRPHTEVHTYFVAGDLNAPAVWVHNACAYRSLNETDIARLRAGQGLVAPGVGTGRVAQAQAVAGRPTGYIPTTEVHPSKLPLGDPANYIRFESSRVPYISKAELLKNKSLDATTRRWVEQQEHSLVKEQIPLSAIEEIIIEGQRFTPPVPGG